MPLPEASIWLNYAEENLAVAKLTLEAGYLNPCLQEAQQATEKSLKAALLAKGQIPRKTHSIRELLGMLESQALLPEISIEQAHLLDSIYLPSKYPLGSALPDAEPTKEVCTQCVAIAAASVVFAQRLLQTDSATTPALRPRAAAWGGIGKL